MRISLKPNVIHQKVTGARRVPLRYKEGADAVVQDLLNKKVIVPVSITTDWCSPAFFVPEADMIRVRLVTDYTHLNKYVKRPVHSFPCTAKILQAIPSTATCFAKLDAVHGYFQLALEPKSLLITTFLLLQGKFRYVRAPMGLNASSDEWCCKSDIIVEGLPWARKLVDDTIIWADNKEDLVIRTRTVLERCKENNMNWRQEICSFFFLFFTNATTGVVQGRATGTYARLAIVRIGGTRTKEHAIWWRDPGGQCYELSSSE